MRGVESGRLSSSTVAGSPHPLLQTVHVSGFSLHLLDTNIHSRIVKLFTLISLGLLALVLNCPADVLVYKIKFAATETGGGTIQKTSYTGSLVMQADTGNYTYIYIDAKGKSFYTLPVTNATVDHVDAGLGKTDLVISELTDTGTFTFKGLESNLSSGAATLLSAGKTLQHTGFEMIYSGTNSFLYEENGTASFDTKTSQMQNGIDGDLDNTVSRLVNQLLLAGYTET
jgi:hypothetical protein